MKPVSQHGRFGFKVSKDRQIDFDANSLGFLNHIMEVEPSIRLCISCGTCASACTAARFTEFSLRRLVLQIRRGEMEGVREAAARCQLCGKCMLSCPRGVNTRNLILQINRAIQLSDLP